MYCPADLLIRRFIDIVTEYGICYIDDHRQSSVTPLKQYPIMRLFDGDQFDDEQFDDEQFDTVSPPSGLWCAMGTDSKRGSGT
jgi:hypothetical protein